jgi:hypothetical protein
MAGRDGKRLEIQRLSPVLTVKVLEVCELDSFPHSQNIGCRRQAVEQHPNITGIQSLELSCRSGTGAGMRLESMLDIGPSGNDGAEDHQAKGEKCHRRHRSTEPKHFAVCNQNDGQILEDRVYGDREESQRLRARVDHTDEEERDREP